jgi:hypothetical protein
MRIENVFPATGDPGILIYDQTVPAAYQGNYKSMITSRAWHQLLRGAFLIRTVLLMIADFSLFFLFQILPSTSTRSLWG